MLRAAHDSYVFRDGDDAGFAADVYLCRRSKGWHSLALFGNQRDFEVAKTAEALQQLTRAKRLVPVTYDAEFEQVATEHLLSREAAGLAELIVDVDQYAVG